MNISDQIVNLCRDPFVMLMLTAKAASNEDDLISLLSDPVELCVARDKRLHEANTTDMATTLQSPDAAKFILLMTDQQWRQEHQLQGEFANLPFAFGELVTGDQHLKSIITGEELTEFQTTMTLAAKKFAELTAA